MAFMFGEFTGRGVLNLLSDNDLSAMVMKRKILAGEVVHTYQRTVSGFNIFYEVEDYLIFYTIFSVLSKRYGVIVYGLCLMIDHVHSLVSVQSLKHLSTFMNEVAKFFVSEYNKEHHRSGPLFCKSYGSALKLGMKLIRTAISYLYNNPVERKLFRYAQEYRWNFLAYGRSPNPFSEPLVIRNASRQLRRCLQEVDGTHVRHRPLSYAQMKRMFYKLDKKEKAQLVDYIIMRYSVIRYDLLTTVYYDGYENMLLAINSNAGSEYEIKEDKWMRSDAEYRKLYKYVHDKNYDSSGDVISASVEIKMELLKGMLVETGVPRFQICKYLHLVLP